MIRGEFALDKHVIDVDFHISAYLVVKDGIDQPLVSGPGILQPKWQHTIMVGASVGDEGGVLLVRWVHQDLVVSREGIHETEHLMTGRGGD